MEQTKRAGDAEVEYFSSTLTFMVKREVKITILIAVYNTAKYLNDCLDSLLTQTMTDFQAVMVDDGSTDDSLKILNTYAQRDPRFEVISLPANQGQAHARNVALQHAVGRYICFLDSDDWLANNALEKIVSVFENYPKTGCVLFDCVMVKGKDKHSYPMPPKTCWSGQEAFQMSQTWRIHGVYAVLRELHLQFPYDETAMTYSDENTTHLHYLFSKEVRYSDAIYYYRQHNDSVTHRVSIRRFDRLPAMESMKKQLCQLYLKGLITNGYSVLKLYEKQRWLQLIDAYYFYIRHQHLLSAVERITAMKKIHKYWKQIDIGQLPLSVRYKFGYMPIRCSWRLFCWQEWLYFALRKWLKREKDLT